MPRRRIDPEPLWEPVTSPAAVAVFTTVLTRQPVSRADIARHTGLSSAAVTKTARPFLEAGYFEELPSDARGSSGFGRPGSPLAIRAEREYFVGVKITAEECIGVVVDLRAQVRATLRATLPNTDIDTTVAELGGLVDRLRDRDPRFRERCHSLGVAISGDVDRTTGLVRYSPFLDWHDVPLGELASRATGLSTVVENDVKALATIEWWFSEGASPDSLALVTVGTGIGCALVLNGGILVGSHGVAGEIGHLPVGDDTVACSCGGRGCVEAIASERAIVERVRAATGKPDLTLADVVALARAGNTSAEAAFDLAGETIGRALAAVANLVGPQRIIVSGEGLAAYDLFERSIRTAFDRQAFGAAGRCQVVVRPLPFEEWARGAAAASIQSLFSPKSGG